MKTYIITLAGNWKTRAKAGSMVEALNSLSKEQQDGLLRIEEATPRAKKSA